MTLEGSRPALLLSYINQLPHNFAGKKEVLILKKKRPRRRRVTKLCDPGMCDHCTYVGEGDFLCDNCPGEAYLVVMSDWEPTEDYLHCMRQHGAGGKVGRP